MRPCLAASDASALRQARLAAYVYAQLRPGEPLRSELRPDYLAALARHQDVKRELVPLVAAWRAAGIETLVFKGFYLNEFIYPAPGSRFHGDVDVLIHPEHGDEALRVARAHGWLERWRPPGRLGSLAGDALFDLYRPGGAAQVDVHRLAVRPAAGWTRRQRRITDAVWARSQAHAWEDTVVRLPSPVDALLVNLVLERAVGDGWRGLKPHDRIDAALLMRRGPVQPQELRERARELGCARTAFTFIRQYGVLSREADAPLPSRLAVARGRLLGLWECGYDRAIFRSIVRALKAPRLAWEMLSVLPVLVRVRLALRRHRDVGGVLRSLTPGAQPSRSPSRDRWRAVRGIHWVCELLPFDRSAGRCLVQALGVYAALRRQGWPVVFVSGVRRDASGLRGHAWVEENGALLRELTAYEVSLDYRANFRHPVSVEAGRSEPGVGQRPLGLPSDQSSGGHPTGEVRDTPCRDFAGPV